MLLHYYPVLWLFSFTCTEEHQKVFQIRIFSFPNTPSQHTIKIFPVNQVVVEHQPPAKDISPEHQYFPQCSPKKVGFESHSRSVRPSGNPSPRQCFEQRVFRFLRRGLSHPQRRAWAATVTPASVPPAGAAVFEGSVQGPFPGRPPARQHFAVLLLVLPTTLRQDKK